MGKMLFWARWNFGCSALSGHWKRYVAALPDCQSGIQFLKYIHGKDTLNYYNLGEPLSVCLSVASELIRLSLKVH